VVYGLDADRFFVIHQGHAHILTYGAVVEVQFLGDLSGGSYTEEMKGKAYGWDVHMRFANDDRLPEPIEIVLQEIRSDEHSRPPGFELQRARALRLRQHFRRWAYSPAQSSASR
jgi:hypothetical protein